MEGAWFDEMKAVSGVRIAPVTVVENEAFYGRVERQRRGLERALTYFETEET